MERDSAAPEPFGPSEFYTFMEQLPARQHVKGNFRGDNWVADDGIVSVYQDSMTCEVRIEDGETGRQYRWDPRFDGTMTVTDRGADGVSSWADTFDDWQEVKRLLDTRPAAEIDFTSAEAAIDALLYDVAAVSDGTNINTFASVLNRNGVELGISKSVHPDGSTGYHVAQRLQKNTQGYRRAWDFHWGDREPKVTETRIHTSRMLSSAWHPNDYWKQRKIGEPDREHIERIIAEYRESKGV